MRTTVKPMQQAFDYALKLYPTLVGTGLAVAIRAYDQGIGRQVCRVPDQGRRRMGVPITSGP